MKKYSQFLIEKTPAHQSFGFEVNGSIGSYLFDFQKTIVRWALRRGRAAVFADCGMGKTIMQLEWAKNIKGPVLILTPLAVAEQTVLEGEKFGIKVKYARKQADASERITITNYEMLDHFEPEKFEGVVLDESSIIKHQDAKTRDRVIEAFQKTPYRLACTATPAPNDFMELGNHAEFLGVMRMEEMLSMFFVHDGGETQKWRLKGHAETEFWKWVCSWAVMIKKPSDIGFEDKGFILPSLNLNEHLVQGADTGEYLFPMIASSLQERLQARRGSIEERAAKTAELVSKKKGPWIVWCNLNAEADAVKALIPGAIEVRGSDSPESKAKNLLAFAAGKIPVMISKASIAGFGMNFQVCHNVVFLGLSDSYEQFYQACRRSWQFGQKKEVNCHIVIAENEGAVLANIKRKENDAEEMAKGMIKHMAETMKSNLSKTERTEAPYKKGVKQGDGWALFLGDSCEILKDVKSDSMHYSIFSPPFSSLYTYSASPRDLGNCKDDRQFVEHFTFIIDQLYRVLMPGRLLSFHCMNLPTSKQHHGYIGIRDFRGDLIRMFEKAGFIFHSEVVIWKDPVTAMQRTKALGLLHKQLKKDAAMSRQGIPDFLVTMRKPGENPEPVSNTNETFPVQVWQNYASPVWMDINPSDTLQYRSAREHKDERHICPLQLEVIRRAVRLWTNPGDGIISPFAGIGSEGYVALEMGRKFLGVELKESYWNQACANLASVNKQVDLIQA